MDPNLGFLIIQVRRFLKKLQTTKTLRGLHILLLGILLVAELNHRGVVQLKLHLVQFLVIEVLAASLRLISYLPLDLLITLLCLIYKLMKRF